MRWLLALLIISLASTSVLAECGDKGGPGYRGPIGKCVGWAELGRTCGNPPTTRCQPEKVATGSTEAANHGMKAWEAGSDARRQPVGRGLGNCDGLPAYDNSDTGVSTHEIRTGLRLCEDYPLARGHLSEPVTMLSMSAMAKRRSCVFSIF